MITGLIPIRKQTKQFKWWSSSLWYTYSLFSTFSVKQSCVWHVIIFRIPKIQCIAGWTILLWSTGNQIVGEVHVAQTRNSFISGLPFFLLFFFYLQITDFKLSIDVAIDNEQQMTIFKRIIHLYTCISDKACKGSDILNDDKVRHFHFEYYNSILYILREIRRCFIWITLVFYMKNVYRYTHESLFIIVF